MTPEREQEIRKQQADGNNGKYETRDIDALLNELDACRARLAQVEQENTDLRTSKVHQVFHEALMEVRAERDALLNARDFWKDEAESAQARLVRVLSALGVEDAELTVVQLTDIAVDRAIHYEQDLADMSQRFARQAVTVAQRQESWAQMRAESQRLSDRLRQVEEGITAIRGQVDRFGPMWVGNRLDELLALLRADAPKPAARPETCAECLSGCRHQCPNCGTTYTPAASGEIATTTTNGGKFDPHATAVSFENAGYVPARGEEPPVGAANGGHVQNKFDGHCVRCGMGIGEMAAICPATGGPAGDV